MGDAVPQTVRTTCPYCGVGCGILATRAADGAVSIEGDPDHPANFGRVCSKGAALGETATLEGRLLHPQIGGRRADWDEALDLVARTFTDTIARHGPESVAFYISGQLLTEDYYTANKLMKGFIGSANIDTNSRLCMASAVAGHRRAFGTDTVPGTYEDMDLADLIVIVGSNLAWCHPVLYQRVAAAKAARPELRVVLIDPRRTMTADLADTHLAIAPDGDVALFLGLLAHLAKVGRIDEAFVARHVKGFGAALDSGRAMTEPDLLDQTGLTAPEIAAFYSLFAATEKTVTLYSQGVNQSVCGTDKVNAIINCHLTTGRIGRPGMGPFSVTGQPNAMGGREVGGLATMLAAHMEIENPDHRTLVRKFWKSPAIPDTPGLKAVDLFDAVADGRVKALWIMATNPVDSLPDAAGVEAAIRACPFVVVSEVSAETDTVRHADVKLPAAAWGEKDGTVTNSERRISRQRRFLPLPGEARPDWWIVAQVARRMGYAHGFGWRSPADIFAEHAALSGYRNGGARDFDISAFAGLDRPGFDALEPFQWPAAPDTPEEPSKRFFAKGGFFTPDRKARMVPVVVPPRRTADADFPLTLNTGRVRDHWHTMTRTGRSARLSAHVAEPFAEIHHADAKRFGIADAAIISVSSAYGTVLLRAAVTDRQRPGSVFVPMHWTDQFAARARIDTLVPPVTDPRSGQPALKNVPVRVESFAAGLNGFAVMRERPARIGTDYWAIAPAGNGWRMELALADVPADSIAFARTLFGLDRTAELLAYTDTWRGDHRVAFFDGERLAGALFLSPEPIAVSRMSTIGELATDHTDQHARFRVIAGRAGTDRPDPGAIVCSCFAVGVNQIAGAVATDAGISVEDIGRILKAGTNCGSCRGEIGEIIDARRTVAVEHGAAD